MNKFTVEDYENIIEFIVNNDLESMIYWHGTKEEGFRPFINCNDVFLWGCADGHEFEPADIPDIMQAIEDCKPDLYYGPILWIARKRNMRPQGAMYEGSGYESSGGISVALRKMFNECGPHRPADIGNPYATPEEDDKQND